MHPEWKRQNRQCFMVSVRSRQKLTLIAGLANEAGVTLAFIGSHALAVLAAGLTQSYCGRIQRGGGRSAQCPKEPLVRDQGDKALNPTAS